MDPIGKLAIKAARLIEERGHCKGVFSDDEGRLCIKSAISMAATPDRGRLGLRLKVDRLMPIIGCSSLVGWNDAPERTAEDVIDVLVAAAYWED